MTLQSQLTTAFTAVGTEVKSVRALTGALSGLSTTSKTNVVSAINELFTAIGSAGAAIDDTTPGALTTYSSNKSVALLALKAPLASPTFTGTVAGVTKTHVGLANVDNTADSAKPVSTAQAAAILALISDASSTSSTTTTYSANKINTAVAAAVAALVASAPSALDTLDELAAALGDDAAFATTVSTALGNRVRWDATQTLTAPESLQARTNINAAGLTTDLGDPTADFAATFAAALV